MRQKLDRMQKMDVPLSLVHDDVTTSLCLSLGASCKAKDERATAEL